MGLSVKQQAIPSTCGTTLGGDRVLDHVMVCMVVRVMETPSSTQILMVIRAVLLAGLCVQQETSPFLSAALGSQPVAIVPLLIVIR